MQNGPNQEDAVKERGGGGDDIGSNVADTRTPFQQISQSMLQQQQQQQQQQQATTTAPTPTTTPPPPPTKTIQQWKFKPQNPGELPSNGYRKKRRNSAPAPSVEAFVHHWKYDLKTGGEKTSTRPPSKLSSSSTSSQQAQQSQQPQPQPQPPSQPQQPQQPQQLQPQPQLPPMQATTPLISPSPSPIVASTNLQYNTNSNNNNGDADMAGGGSGISRSSSGTSLVTLGKSQMLMSPPISPSSTPRGPHPRTEGGAIYTSRISNAAARRPAPYDRRRSLPFIHDPHLDSASAMPHQLALSSQLSPQPPHHQSIFSPSYSIAASTPSTNGGNHNNSNNNNNHHLHTFTHNNSNNLTSSNSINSNSISINVSKNNSNPVFTSLDLELAIELQQRQLLLQQQQQDLQDTNNLLLLQQHQQLLQHLRDQAGGSTIFPLQPFALKPDSIVSPLLSQLPPLSSLLSTMRIEENNNDNNSNNKSQQQPPIASSYASAFQPVTTTGPTSIFNPSYTFPAMAPPHITSSATPNQMSIHSLLDETSNALSSTPTTSSTSVTPMSISNLLQ
eukprot:TRINITY_DN67_c0_g2_i1.p1 TRINITY_DN67_c0_g2~~TRINITY_DN67_c0_g2_i1.p1  ORF type:complete len:559 (+),score=180.69 TRINITY_DN67_c0_g2_i1:52-1728(+)